jgi:hypothetical protein
MKRPEIPASTVIDELGGTKKVADLCEVTLAAVSQWRTSKTGIPKDKLKILRLLRPDVFEKLDAEPVPERVYRGLPNRKNVAELWRARPRVDDALPARRPLPKK